MLQFNMIAVGQTHSTSGTSAKREGSVELSVAKCVVPIVYASSNFY